MTQDVQQQVDAVPDELIVPVLALLLDRQGRLPDAHPLQQAQQQVADAAAGRDPIRVVDDSTSDEPVDATAPPEAWASSPVSETELARAALTHLLASQPELVADLPRAVRLASSLQEGERFEPGSLIVAGLVLVVLQTEVKWSRASTGRWQLLVHKRAMRDSTLATNDPRPVPTADGRRPSCGPGSAAILRLDATTAADGLGAATR